MAPTRNEPCSSENTSGVTLAVLIESSSMIANEVSGNSAATFFSEVAYANPTATTGLYPPWASSRSRSSFWASVSPWVASSSLVSRPSSLFALSRPRAAESLNDWSPRPPTSYARPTLSFFAADVVALPPAELVLVELPLLDEPQALSARAAVAASASTLVTRRKGVSFAVLGPAARGPPGGGRHARTGVDAPEGNPRSRPSPARRAGARET